MARFGFLYLNNGVWEDRQIVPAQWVRDSTQIRQHPKSLRRVIVADGDFSLKKTVLNWVVYNLGWAFSDGYGYQWWIDESGIYSAVGYGGQYIMVVPDKQLVVVFTSVLKPTNFAKPGRMLKTYIIPSISSGQAITPNEAGLKRLERLTRPIDGNTPSTGNIVLPEMARKISGRTFTLEDNKYKYRKFSLTFQPGKKTAVLKQVWGNRYAIALEIGLDNVYRITDSGNKQTALKGYWSDDNRFIYLYQDIGGTGRGRAEIRFEDNKATYSFNIVTQGENPTLSAQAD